MLAVRLQALGLGELGKEGLLPVGGKLLGTLDMIAGAALFWSALERVHEEKGRPRRPA
jgi:hypothetical protein